MTDLESALLDRVGALETRVQELTDFLYEHHGNSMPYDVCQEQQEKRRLKNLEEKKYQAAKAERSEYFRKQYYKKMGWPLKEEAKK